MRTLKIASAWCFFVCSLLLCTGSQAFDLSTHRTILMEALARSNFVVNGNNLSFDSDVVFQIDDENGALDRLSLLGSDPVWHVDDEKIAESNQRIIGLRADVIAKLSGSNPQIKSARALLGRALHTLTDFYAHTNWVDLGNTGPNSAFGRRALSESIAAAGEQTCDADGATLKSVGLTKLTSGYYAGVNKCDVPSGKCRHGGPSQCPGGISKDATNGPRHSAAKKAAIEAVKTFVSDLLVEAATGGRTSLVTRFAREK